MGEIIDFEKSRAAHEAKEEEAAREGPVYGRKVDSIDSGFVAEHQRKIQEIKGQIRACVDVIDSLSNDLLDPVQQTEAHIIRRKLAQTRQERDALIEERNRTEALLKNLKSGKEKLG